MLERLNENKTLYQAKTSCSLMSEQPVELSSIKIELLSKTILHCGVALIDK